MNSKKATQFATTGNTAAEIIYHRADSEMPYIGLTTWKMHHRVKYYRVIAQLLRII